MLLENKDTKTERSMWNRQAALKAREMGSQVLPLDVVRGDAKITELRAAALPYGSSSLQKT